MASRPFVTRPTDRQVAATLHETHTCIIAIGSDWRNLPAPTRLRILACAHKLEPLLAWYPRPSRRKH